MPDDSNYGHRVASEGYSAYSAPLQRIRVLVPAREALSNPRATFGGVRRSVRKVGGLLSLSGMPCAPGNLHIAYAQVS
jgi:hypothetical protein